MPRSPSAPASPVLLELSGPLPVTASVGRRRFAQFPVHRAFSGRRLVVSANHPVDARLIAQGAGPQLEAVFAQEGARVTRVTLQPTGLVVSLADSTSLSPEERAQLMARMAALLRSLQRALSVLQPTFLQRQSAWIRGESFKGERVRVPALTALVLASLTLTFCAVVYWVGLPEYDLLPRERYFFWWGALASCLLGWALAKVFQWLTLPEPGLRATMVALICAPLLQLWPWLALNSKFVGPVDVAIATVARLTHAPGGGRRPELWRMYLTEQAGGIRDISGRYTLTACQYQHLFGLRNARVAVKHATGWLGRAVVLEVDEVLDTGATVRIPCPSGRKG